MYTVMLKMFLTNQSKQQYSVAIALRDRSQAPINAANELERMDPHSDELYILPPTSVNDVSMAAPSSNPWPDRRIMR
jgi:hypothetical protein